MEKENTAPDQPGSKKEPKPILALSLFCMDDQVKILEKLDEARQYIAGLTPKEFEGKHQTKDGTIIKIVNLQ